jgi:hypothetical protein
LGHAHIDAAIAVAIHHMGAHARLDLQDGPQNVRVDTMALRGGHEALVCSRLGFGRGLGMGCGVRPRQHTQAKGRRMLKVKA